jgi:hypothetical protein
MVRAVVDGLIRAYLKRIPSSIDSTAATSRPW